MMGDMVSNMINNPGFSWACSPLNTELEVVVTDWMARALGLPDHFLHTSGVGGGVLQTTASDAAFYTLAAVINKAKTERFSVYHNDQTHCALEKNANILRVPQIHSIPTRFDETA
jgi:aromatic-L-amino-acid decarboxylase